MFFEGLDIFLSPKGVENMRQMSGLLWSYILHVFLTLNVQYDSYTWNMCRKWCNFWLDWTHMNLFLGSFW